MLHCPVKGKGKKKGNWQSLLQNKTAHKRILMSERIESLLN